MSIRYSKEVHEFIKNNVEGIRTRDLVKLVNDKFATEFTDLKMKAYKANHNLKSGVSSGVKKRNGTKLFPMPINNYIKKNYIGIGPSEMSRKLNDKFGTNYSKGQIKNFYNNHNLNSGLTGQFLKGCKPLYVAPKGTHSSRKTEFKKGHTPVNHRKVGSERITKDGYIEIKTADPRTWKLKHRVEWEKVNGPIPADHKLIFADKNKLNIKLDNLLLVSNRQQLIMNRKELIKDNPEMTKTGVLIAKVHEKIYDSSK